MSGWVVAAAANGDFELVRAREVERGGHIVSAEAPDDHRGSAIDESVEASAGTVVL
jgi:hypothetical protein